MAFIKKTENFVSLLKILPMDAYGVCETFANPPLFVQFLRQTQILILKILNVFMWLKLSPSLNLGKNKHFSKVSMFEMVIL